MAKTENKTIGKLLLLLEKVPKYLREGPWSLMAYFVIFTFVYALLFTFPIVKDSLSEPSRRLFDVNIFWLQLYRLSMGCYCLILVNVLVKNAGYLPLASYTVTSWNLLTMRLLLSFAGEYSSFLRAASDLFRFPALVGCSITVTIWWSAIVPLIYALSDSKGREDFWKFNWHPMLVNLHLLNLPIVAVEFVLTGAPLTLFDLWLGYLVALLYILFYLNVLDARGLHFYIILTPRTVFCIVPYIVIVLLYFIIYSQWNKALVFSSQLFF